MQNHVKVMPTHAVPMLLILAPLLVEVPFLQQQSPEILLAALTSHCDIEIILIIQNQLLLQEGTFCT